MEKGSGYARLFNYTVYVHSYVQGAWNIVLYLLQGYLHSVIIDEADILQTKGANITLLQWLLIIQNVYSYVSVDTYLLNLSLLI